MITEEIEINFFIFVSLILTEKASRLSQIVYRERGKKKTREPGR